jgi:hypothetical protein
LGGAGRSRTIGRAAALLMLGGAALAVAGCGGGHRSATPQALQLRRADLVAVSRALSGREQSVRSEVAATKAAWPLLARGLPAHVSMVSQPAIRTATERAAALTLPGLFEERQAAAITGPGSGLTGTYRTFSILAERGWRMIGAAVEAIERGSPAAARFARANVALYIESVYDAHFVLGQIGKQLLAGYKKLGGQAAFGASLTQAEVTALADTYSESSDQLYPHSKVRLGS